MGEQQILDAVSGLSAEQFAKDLGSSHPSVRDTLLHIVWAEWIWLQRWIGISPKVVFQAVDFPSPEAVKARWFELEIEQRQFLDALSNGSWRTFNTSTFRGKLGGTHCGGRCTTS